MNKRRIAFTVLMLLALLIPAVPVGAEGPGTAGVGAADENAEQAAAVITTEQGASLKALNASLPPPVFSNGVFPGPTPWVADEKDFYLDTASEIKGGTLVSRVKFLPGEIGSWPPYLEGGMAYAVTVITGLHKGDIVHKTYDQLWTDDFTNGPYEWFNGGSFNILIDDYTHNPVSNRTIDWLHYAYKEADGSYTLVTGQGVYYLVEGPGELPSLVGYGFRTTESFEIYRGGTLINPLLSSRGYTYSNDGVDGGTIIATQNYTNDEDIVHDLNASGTHYGDVAIGNWGNGNLDDRWDLTRCDLVLAYTIDMSAIETAGWAVTEVGLREVGAPNIDPNLLGGWMQSNYINGASNPTSQNVNDMHLLSKHGWMYQEYDAQDADTLVTPYWSNNNYGFWFDRDGVDPWQTQLWGAVDNATYNTGGAYDVVITYHAIDATTGTMFATINGVQQGLYTGGWKNAPPEFYPVGRSFTGNMTQMLAFYGRGGGGGTVTLSDIQVLGCPYEEPTAIELASFTAEVSGGTVTLAWETAAEIDNAGFNLYRAAAPDGPYTKVNSALIAAQGGPASRAAYNFVNAGLTTGIYYYQLEDVDYAGVATLHGPVQVTLAPVFRRPLYRPTLPR